MEGTRTERLAVNRDVRGTTVKVTITEDGATVAYTVKTFERSVAVSVAEARAGAERLLAQVREALEVPTERKEAA